MCRMLLLVLSILVQYSIASLNNITIDDTDDRIVYEGTWNDRSIYNSPLDYGGSHSLSEDNSAAAIFTFTGVAVYYLAPLWPYKVNTEVTLDNGPSAILDLTDTSAKSTGNGPETVMWNVRWSQTGLSNTPHTLRISMAPVIGQYIVVDGIMYTADEPSTSIAVSSLIPPSSSSSSSTPPASSSTSPSSSSTLPLSYTPTSTIDPVSTPVGTKSNTLAIALGVALGVVTLLAAIALSVFCLRRKQGDPRASYQSAAFPHPSASPSPNSVASFTGTESGSRPLTYYTNGSTSVPHSLMYPSRIGDVGTVHDPYNHQDSRPLLSTGGEDSYNPYLEYAQPSPMVLSGSTMSWDQSSYKQSLAFRLQHRDSREGNDVSLPDSDSQLKSPLPPSNLIDYARYRPNAEVVSSSVSTWTSVSAEKKQQDSCSNAASVSNMNSEADVVKSKQAAPARCDTVADASQAVDRRVGIDDDDEDPALTERWMQGLMIGESPPEYYQ